MPLGDLIGEGIFRFLFHLLFEIVAYYTGFVVLYPFTAGRVRRWNEDTVSLVGIGFWAAVFGLWFLSAKIFGPE